MISLKQYLKHLSSYLHLGGTARNTLALSAPMMMLRRVYLRVTVGHAIGCRRPWTTSRMPNRGSLQEHFFAISKGITALGAPRASRMKMMVFTGLQYFAAYVAVAVSAFDSELFLIVFFAIRHPVSAKIFILRYI